MEKEVMEGNENQELMVKDFSEMSQKTNIIKIAAFISNLLLKLHIDIRRKLFKCNK